MLVWLQSPDVQIARQAASNAMYGYNPSKEQDPCRRMELAYNRAQRDGCKMSGWPLHMIIYLETAEVTKLYAKRAVN